MADVILTDIEDNSGMIAAINENFGKLENAINLTLGKANDATNTVNTPLDMNSQRIINLPAPVGPTDAARLQDVIGSGSSTALPSVTGQAGKFLGTDGTSAIWTSFSTVTIPTSQITGDLTGNAANVNGTVVVGHGGTGATSLTGYVKGTGTSPLTASSTIPGSDISGNIAGSAAGLTTTLAVASGGTGQTTEANAINALVPSQTGNGGKYLSTNGSVVSWQSAPSGGGGGTVTDITAGAGLTGGLITISGTISITDTGVTAASYGAASKTLTATVNSRGQLTSLAETPIAITGAQVSGDIAGNAANITGTVTVAHGGTGATTLTGYVKGSGAAAFTAVSSIPQADVTGLVSGLAGKADNTITISGGTSSVTGGGDLTANRILSLVNDSTSPGNSQYYGTNSSGTKGWYATPSATLQVSTIAALVALSPTGLTSNQVYKVLGYSAIGDGGGGDFYWDSSSTATANNGTIFQPTVGGTGRWMRIIDGPEAVNVLWFGADKTGTTDTSTAMQAAYDYAAGSPYSRVLEFSVGTFKGSLNLSDNLVSVKGAGAYSTAITPATATGYCFKLTAATGSLQPPLIEGFHFLGSGTLQGVGFDHADNSTAAIVRRCYFQNFDKCVSRSYGNFQEWYDDCTMTAANYHFYSVSDTDAQCGSLVVRGGNYGQSEKAHFFFNGSTIQSGQVTYDSNVMIQGNTGWVFFIENANSIGNSGFNISATYNENIPTASSITVGSVTAVPTFAYIGNANSVSFYDTSMGPMTIVNSTVTTTNCELTYIGGTTIDSNSTLMHYNGRWNNYANIPGRVQSLCAISGTTINTGTWATMPQLLYVAKVPGATVIKKSDSSANLTYALTPSGTVATTNATDNGIGSLGTCQDLSMTGAQTLTSPDSGGTTITAGPYICWVWVGKLVSGTAPNLDVRTGNPFSLSTPVSSGEFTTRKGMLKLADDSNFFCIRYVSSATCVVREAGWAILSFTSLEHALAFLNSPVFPA